MPEVQKTAFRGTYFEPSEYRDVWWIRNTELSRVFRYARRWGIDIVLGTTATPVRPGRKLHYGPSTTTAIWWPDRYILVNPDGLDDHDLPSLLVHEMGHCLAEGDPDEVEVENLVLAFDWASHRHLKLSGWGHWMMSFVASEDGDVWPDLTYRQRGAVLRHSRNVAEAAGVLTKTGCPTFVRPAWMVKG